MIGQVPNSSAFYSIGCCCQWQHTSELKKEATNSERYKIIRTHRCPRVRFETANPIFPWSHIQTQIVQSHTSYEQICRLGSARRSEMVATARPTMIMTVTQSILPTTPNYVTSPVVTSTTLRDKITCNPLF